MSPKPVSPKPVSPTPESQSPEVAARADVGEDGHADRSRSLFVGVALVAVVAALAWVGFSLAADDGATDPDAAVRQLFEALDGEDTTGILEALAPSERAALAGPVEQLTSALREVGVAPGDGDDPLDGVDISADAITTRTPAGASAVAPVDIVAGRLVVDVWPALDPRGRAALGLLLGSDIEDGLLRDFSLDPAQLTAVAEGDRWYVSLLRSAGAPTPAPPEATSSPEAVVESLFDALAAQDPDAVEALLVGDLGGALLGRSTFLFPDRREGRPDIDRRVQVHSLELATTGAGREREVVVEALTADLVTEVHRADLTYDGTCFEAAYRWSPAADPFARFRTCNSQGTQVTLDTPAGTVTSPSAASGEKETDAGAAQDREQQRESEAGQTDSFGQPIEVGAEARLELPTSRPADTPFASLATFGGGADFPTFVVVETEEGWRIDPVATATRSLVATIRATPDVEDLARRAAGLRGNALEAEAIAYESRDPDNLLFGPPAAHRLTAACFVEIFPVVGEATALQVYPGCVTELLDTGALAASDVSIGAFLGHCYSEPPREPPALDNPFRRLHFAEVAVTECVQAAVDAGEAPPEVLDNLPGEDAQVCFGPYLELERTDPEARWAAADREVETCARARIPAPR